MKKTKEIKNVVIADCSANEVAEITEVLDREFGSFSTGEHISNWQRSGRLSEMRRYAKYFLVALRYFLRHVTGREKYGMLVGWQQFYALIFSYYCSLFRVKRKPTVVALNFTYRKKNGRAGAIYRRFMGRCVSNVDLLHIPSEDYKKDVCAEFGIPEERVIVTAFGVPDPYEEYSALARPEGIEEHYALSIGRSNRDYPFLERAWEGIKLPLYIISDTYRADAPSAENVRVLCNVAGERSYPYIAHCDMMLLPIDDLSICSGDTVLLTSLALKKPTVLTGPGALSDTYIEQGKNAVIVPKDPDRFREAVRAVLAGDYPQLSERARESYLALYSRRSMAARIAGKLKGAQKDPEGESNGKKA